jgi:hypothetical protein
VNVPEETLRIGGMKNPVIYEIGVFLPEKKISFVRAKHTVTPRRWETKKGYKIPSASVTPIVLVVSLARMYADYSCRVDRYALPAPFFQNRAPSPGSPFFVMQLDPEACDHPTGEIVTIRIGILFRKLVNEHDPASGSGNR